MSVIIRLAGAIIASALLASCGGGGGDGASPAPAPVTPIAPPVNPDGTWLSFTQTSYSVIAFEGYVTPFTISAVANKTFSTPVNIGVVDKNGVVLAAVEASKHENTYSARLMSSDLLKLGTHATSLEVRLCEDDPMSCKKPLAGSPWFVPVTVNVKPAAEAKARLSLSPAAFDLTREEGELLNLTMIGALSAPEIGTQAIYALISDPTTRLIAATGSGDANTAQQITVKTRGVSLAPGNYSTNLKLELCYDIVCQKPVAGSPWAIPLKVAVSALTNLKPLSPEPTLASWSTYRGNALRNAYLPATFDPANFSRRFSIASRYNYSSLPTSLAIDNGKVFMVRQTPEGQMLEAISEETGKLVWSVNFGPAGDGTTYVTSPAAANGRLYVNSGLRNSGGQDFLYVLDQVDGKLLHKIPMGVNAASRPPAVAGNFLLQVAGTENLGMSNFDAITAQPVWESHSSTAGTAAVSFDSSFAYLYTFSHIQGINLSDGSTAFMHSAQLPAYKPRRPTVVLSGHRHAFINADDRIVAFDTVSRAPAWEVMGAFTGDPAYAKNVLYAIEGGKFLEARDGATGALLWSAEFEPIDNLGLSYNTDEILVTENLAFISGTTKTIAIDLTTKKVVWSHPLGGSISISKNAILYILTWNDELRAINLR